MSETPTWTPADEAMRWLNEVELAQGGANGPTIKLRAAILALGEPADAEIKRLRAALTKIARWHGEFPPTGKFWDYEQTRQTSFASEYGSNGERDFMRQQALEALGPNE